MESAVRFACGRWWRTMTATDPAAAQVSFDHFCATIADRRLRPPGQLMDPPADGSRAPWPTVAELAATEALRALPPVPYPAQIAVVAPVGANATVAFRGNRYAVPPGLLGADLQLRHRLGTHSLEIHAPSGVRLASHRLAPRGSGAVVRSPEQAAALEQVVLAQFTTQAPCDRKGNYPPGAAARAEAERVLAGLGPAVVVDLDAYAQVVEAGWR
ncbi:MAG TPA: transposase [Candidatus Dormibacteraeota bacterium]|nr:transposase [Candidatus Dormibacteraeota bacterium]